MKPSRHKKVLGLSIGERSIQVAEVTAGDKPEIRQIAELVYASGVNLDQPAELGAALVQFLRARFSMQAPWKK